jgi:hypothetical protein
MNHAFSLGASTLLRPVQLDVDMLCDALSRRRTGFSAAT